MSIFSKLVDETQMSTTPEATSHHSSRKLSILLPLRAIQNLSFHYETPCTYLSDFKNKLEIFFSNFVAFSRYLNFNSGK